MNDVTRAAHAYAEVGVFPLPIPHGSKAPALKGWQGLRLTPEDVPLYFNGAPQNVGVNLSASGLADVDLDSPEAVALARLLLPETRTFGRASKRRSHYLYRLPEPVRTERFQVATPDGPDTLVEVRCQTRKGTPCQTVFPPSTHPSGEAVAWEGPVGHHFAEVDGDDLRRRARCLAGVAVLARLYPVASGGRHDAAGALASVLARSEVVGYVPVPDAVRAIAAAAGDDDAGDRATFAADTVAALERGESVTGAPRLAELLCRSDADRAALRKALDWIGFEGGRLKVDAPAAPSPTVPPAREPVPAFVPFPTDALPAVLADAVRAHGAALNVDEAALAVPMLAALCAAVGNSYEAEPKPGWRERPALWACLVQPSGTLKSQSVYVAVAPVLALEREAAERYAEDREAFDETLADWNALGRGEKQDTPKPTPPGRSRYRTGDTTIESLGSLHADAPRGLLLYRDEGSGWLGSFNRYARGDADMAHWIELCGGRPIVIDRKSDERGVLYVERPNVSVVVTIQPGTLEGNLGPAHFASGFAARLLLTEPPTRPRRWTDASAAPDVDAAYHALIRALYAEDTEAGVLPFAPDAARAFAAFYDENGAVLDGLPDGPLRASVSKVEGYAVRLALAFHLCDSHARAEAPGPIPARAIGQAVTVARWLRYEQARVYRLHGFDRLALDADGRKALALPETFGWRDVADVWGVGKSGAYVALGRLLEKRLADDTGHGTYRKTDRGRVDSVDYGALLRPTVHKVQSSTRPPLTPGAAVVTPAGPGVVTALPEAGSVSVDVDGLPVRFPISSVTAAAVHNSEGGGTPT